MKEERALEMADLKLRDTFDGEVMTEDGENYTEEAQGMFEELYHHFLNQGKRVAVIGEYLETKKIFEYLAAHESYSCSPIQVVDHPSRVFEPEPMIIEAPYIHKELWVDPHEPEFNSRKDKETRIKNRKKRKKKK